MDGRGAGAFSRAPSPPGAARNWFAVGRHTM